jgi:hypothetical protein
VNDPVYEQLRKRINDEHERRLDALDLVFGISKNGDESTLSASTPEETAEPPMMDTVGRLRTMVRAMPPGNYQVADFCNRYEDTYVIPAPRSTISRALNIMLKDGTLGSTKIGILRFFSKK